MKPGWRVTQSRLPWATLAVAAIALAVQAWPGSEDALEINRAFSRVWSRLWTAHIVHFGGSHLFWNLAIFLPAGIWAERLVPWRTRFFYLVGPPFIGLVLLAFDREMANYRGLSGVAAGVLALLAWARLRKLPPGGRWFWHSVLVLIAIKIAMEAYARRSMLVEFDYAEAQPVPLAHVAGVLCAAVVFLLPRPWRWRGESR